MKFLVTGGAGFLGRNLVKFLTNKGHCVISYDRNNFPESSGVSNVQSVKGDIRDKELILNSLDGVEVIVHTAAGQPNLPEQEIFSIDIDGTWNVMEAAYQKNVKRVIHISTASVYGFPDHSPVYENDELKGSTPYAMGKIKSEEICLEYRKKGLCITILRPKKFIGHERLGILNVLYDWASGGRGFPILGNGNNHYQLLDVDDLCEAIYLAAMADEKAANDTYNIGAKNFMTMKEDYQSVLDYAGFGKKIRTTPVRPIIFTLRFLEILKIAPLYKFVYETASKESILSTEKAEKFLGYNPQYSNKEILIRNFQWYLEQKDSLKNTRTNRDISLKNLTLSVVKLFF